MWLRVFMSVFVCVFVFVCVCFCVFVCRCVCVYVCLFVCFCVFFGLCMCEYLSLCVLALRLCVFECAACECFSVLLCGRVEPASLTSPPPERPAPLRGRNPCQARKHPGYVASQGGRPLGGVGPSGGPESLGDFDTTGVWTPQGGQVVNKKMESLKGAKTKKRGTNQAINM